MGRILGKEDQKVEADLREALDLQSRFEGLLQEGWLPLMAMEGLKAGANEGVRERMPPDPPSLTRDHPTQSNWLSVGHSAVVCVTGKCRGSRRKMGSA